MVSRRSGFAPRAIVGAASLGLLAVAIALRFDPPPAEAQAPLSGEGIYLERCAFCHGSEGEGDGPVARYLNPRPRDFTLGQFRFRTTASGELPLRSDIVTIVKNGVEGTAMPRWAGVLTDAEIGAVVDYLTTSFVPFWGTYEPPVIEIPRPPRVSATMIEEGATLFQELQCWKCHGEQGRGDGPSAATLTDETDRPIRPADLSKAWRYKGGSDLVSIYTRFSTGMDGTPMPSFYEVTSDDGRWALAAYVRSLQSDQPTGESVVRAAFVSDQLPSDPDHELWDRAEPTSFYLTGQALYGPRWQTPGVDAVTVRALYNADQVALKIEWNDPFSDSGGGEPPASPPGDTYVDLEAFGPQAGALPDGLAVQFPAKLTEGVRKPHFAWGQPGNPVNLWIWKADGEAREFNASGLNADLVPQADSTVTATVSWNAGRYRLVLARALQTSDPNDIQFTPGKFIPIAFQAWEGASGESGSQLSLSSWNSLVLEQPTPPSAFLFAGLAVLVVGAGEWWLYRRVRS